jgi:hypothetical protein
MRREELVKEGEPGTVAMLGHFVHFMPARKGPDKNARVGKSAQPIHREAFRLINRHGPTKAANILGKLDKDYETLVWKMFSSRPEVFGHHSCQKGKNPHQI